MRTGELVDLNFCFKPLNSTDGNSSGQDGNMCPVDAKGNGQFGEHKVFDRQISADNVENHISDKPHDSISHKTNNYESLHGELPKLAADDVDKYFTGLSLTKKRAPRNSENVFFPSTFVPPASEIPLSPEIVEIPFSPEIVEIPFSPEIVEIPFSPEIVEIPFSPEIVEIPFSPEIVEIPFSPEIVEIQHSPEIVEIPKALNDHLPDYTMEEFRMIYQGQMEKECCPCRDIFFKGEYSVVEMINKNYSERLIAKVKRENNIPDHVYLPDPFKRPVGSRTLKKFHEYKAVREYKRQKEREQQGLPDQEQAHYQHYDQNHQNWCQSGDDGHQLYQQKSLQLHEPPYQASFNNMSRLLGGQRKPVNYNWEEFQMCVAVESVIALGPLTPEEALGCTEDTNTDEFKQAYKEHWDRITQEMIFNPCEPEITVDDVLAFPELEPALHGDSRKRLAEVGAVEFEPLSKKMATDTNPSVPTVTESHQSTTTIRVIDGPSMELDGFTCSNPNEVRNNTYSRVSHSRSARAREYKWQKKEREQQGLPDQEQAHYQHYDQNHQNWRQPGDDGQQLYQQKSLQLHEPPYQASFNNMSRLLGGQRKPVNYNWKDLRLSFTVGCVAWLGPLTPEEALGCTEGTNTDEFKQAYKEHWDRITQEMIYNPCEPEITVDDVLAFPELEPALHDRFRKRLAAARAGETEELEESPQKKQDLIKQQTLAFISLVVSHYKTHQLNHQEDYNTYNRVAGDPMPDNILEDEDDNMEKEELAFPELEPALHGDSRKRLAEVGAVEFEPLSKKMATDTNPSVPTVTESHQSTTTIRVIDGPSMELDGFTCSNPNEVRNNTYSRVSHSRSASLSTNKSINESLSTNKSIGSRGTSVGENNDLSPRSSSRSRFYTTSEDEQSDSDDKKSEGDSWDWSEDEVFEPAEDVVAETGSEKSGNSTPNEGILDELAFFSD